MLNRDADRSARGSRERRWLSREQLLRWRLGWSTNDLRMIEENLDRLDVQSFEERDEGGRVDCFNPAGRKVMELRPGYAMFLKGFELPDENDPDRKWLTFSTFQPYEKVNSHLEDNPAICPTCHMALPLTGECDTCEE